MNRFINVFLKATAIATLLAVIIVAAGFVRVNSL